MNGFVLLNLVFFILNMAMFLSVPTKLGLCFTMCSLVAAALSYK